MVPINLDRDALGSLEQVADREWLVTNGIGGFASSTVGLLNTRRYHGLLVAALQPPVGRVVLVAKLEALARYAGGITPLATNEFADGTIDPRGYHSLGSFRLEGQLPVWTWIIADAVLEQRLWMSHGHNTTYVQYTLLRATTALELELKPLCTYRDHHALRRGYAEVNTNRTLDGVEVIYAGSQPYRITCAECAVTPRPEWDWSFKYRDEAARGLDAVEDLFSPVVMDLTLRPGESRTVVLNAEAHASVAVVGSTALDAERVRQSQLLAVSDRKPGGVTRTRPTWVGQLILAADQFIVDRNTGGAVGKTVIAGYPWFSDWGRDTMIALPGLALVTGRLEIAASILRTFAGFLSQGMLPNRFPDDGAKPEYNTVDATLWFFVAVDAYLRRSADGLLRTELYPALKESVDWHLRGTRYGIGMDTADALLRCGETGTQLTWMDARVGDWVVTPRIGKCVEINALWYNALGIMQRLAEQERDPDAARHYGALSARVASSFERRFWNASMGHLYDVIDGPDGEVDESGARCDSSLRPNQLLALSLRHPLVQDARARAVVDICARRLWTPVGLRSLAADDSLFVPYYRGGQRDRDGAYHQGTVWSWLLGPFVIAHFKAYGDAASARSYLAGIEGHLREACVGQISEIFDGAAPFAPRGCYAQAWSVGQILEAWDRLDV